MPHNPCDGGISRKASHSSRSIRVRRDIGSYAWTTRVNTSGEVTRGSSRRQSFGLLAGERLETRVGNGKRCGTIDCVADDRKDQHGDRVRPARLVRKWKVAEQVAEYQLLRNRRVGVRRLNGNSGYLQIGQMSVDTRFAVIPFGCDQFPVGTE